MRSKDLKSVMHKIMTGEPGALPLFASGVPLPGADVRKQACQQESELLKPLSIAQQIRETCVMLSGGSAYGLAAGDGAMQFLEEKAWGLMWGVGLCLWCAGRPFFDLVVGGPHMPAR